MNYYQEVMKIHRKTNASVPGWSDDTYDAVKNAMRERGVRFLPRQYVRRVVMHVTKRQEEIDYACKYLQGGLGF